MILWLSGIVCWLLDYFGCHVLFEGKDSIRERYLVFLPNPQLHSFWHLFATAGYFVYNIRLYLMTLAVVQRRAVILGHQVALDFYWGLPYMSICHVHFKRGEECMNSSSKTRKLVKSVQ